MNRYESEDEIEQVVRGFETCETGADDFHHAQHLAVAVWYVHTLNRDAALDRMRAGLVRFLDHHGVEKGKYSETVTAFYIDKIAEKLNELGPQGSIVEKCNAVLAADFRGLKTD
ncbi:MAG TPA: hypothetical protein VE931_11540 [Pyrinomonadaceae bacterium]|nr:hypothetical protein [Pyrinomonadaceae bacterium]